MFLSNSVVSPEDKNRLHSCRQNPFIDKGGFMYKYEKKPILNMWSKHNRTKKKKKIKNGTFDMTKENPLGGENSEKDKWKGRWKHWHPKSQLQWARQVESRGPVKYCINYSEASLGLNSYTGGFLKNNWPWVSTRCYTAYSTSCVLHPQTGLGSIPIILKTNVRYTPPSS